MCPRLRLTLPWRSALVRVSLNVARHLFHHDLHGQKRNHHHACAARHFAHVDLCWTVVGETGFSDDGFEICAAVGRACTKQTARSQQVDVGRVDLFQLDLRRYSAGR